MGAGGGGGVAQGLGVTLFAFGGAYWPPLSKLDALLWPPTRARAYCPTRRRCVEPPNNGHAPCQTDPQVDPTDAMKTVWTMGPSFKIAPRRREIHNTALATAHADQLWVRTGGGGGVTSTLLHHFWGYASENQHLSGGQHKPAA